MIAELLFSTNPEAAPPLMAMIGQMQWSIEDVLGQLSRQVIEQLLVAQPAGIQAGRGFQTGGLAARRT